MRWIPLQLKRRIQEQGGAGRNWPNTMHRYGWKWGRWPTVVALWFFGRSSRPVSLPEPDSFWLLELSMILGDLTGVSPEPWPGKSVCRHARCSWR